MHANLQKIFMIRVFWFKYIFPIKYKICTLDLMLLPKNSVPFEGLYYSNKNNNKFVTSISFIPLSVFVTKVKKSLYQTSCQPSLNRTLAKTIIGTCLKYC